MSKRRTKRLIAVAVGLSLVAAACGDDDDGGDTATDDTTAETEAGGAADTTAAPAETSGEGTQPDGTEPADTEGGADTTTGESGGEGADGVAMAVTVNLNPDAVWEDGTPITYGDLECTWRAQLNTPGSIETAGWDQITAVRQGDSEKQAIIEFASVYGPYKSLFYKIIKAAAVENCDDISGDFQTEMPISGRAVMLESWSESQSVIVPNPNYWGDDPMVSESFVMVPQADQDTEVASILAGQVDFIYPQFDDSIGAALQDPNIEIVPATGGDYEAFYFQQYEGPFADDAFREAFSKSIDREAVFEQIYAPIYEAAGAEGELLNCGPIVQGPYCPEDNFQDTYDPEGAEALLTENGWERNGEGFWAKDGEAPEIRWMINAGNLRRENTQAFLIPRLQEAGFNVVPDNGTAEEVFQQRLPAMDYDMGMYISTAPPDPQYLVPILTCDNIPTEENNFQGQNTQGWCNDEATEMLHRSDVTPDPEERTQLIQDALRLTDTDHVLLPLANYPKAGVWRTDRVAGPVDAELANYRAFNNFHLWEDVDGDGQVVLGAEQWPACLNPITECSNSSWSVWTAAFPFLPAIWDATNEQGYEITNLVTEEPTVEVFE